MKVHHERYTIWTVLKAQAETAPGQRTFCGRFLFIMLPGSHALPIFTAATDVSISGLGLLLH